MRIFLTGATGFIGSHVLKAALSAGHDVIALRRRQTSVPVISLSQSPIWCDGDLDQLSPSWFEGVDAVLHLASAGVSPKKVHWSKLLHVNVVQSLSLMDIAATAHVPRFVAAGTCHEYGTAACRTEFVLPNSPLEPLTPYASSKAAAFHLLRTYSIENHIEFFYGRIYNAFGEGQFAENFWPSLFSAATSGSDFPMTSGSQICDFIHVSSVAEHLVRACTRLDIQPGNPLVANIGTGIPTSLLSFAQLEWARLGAKGKLIPGALPDRPSLIPRNVPDLSGLYIPSSIV